MNPTRATWQSLATEFHACAVTYQSTAETNDRLHGQFTALTSADPLLSAHRQYVEANRLGFGDPAFHALWVRLLAAACERFGNVQALEIGVFKGQVISLWALLARHYAWPVRIHALTPLQGDPLPPAGWWRSLRFRLSRRFRERITSGDFYPLEDYEAVVRAHFAHHGLSFDEVVLHRGLSTDSALRATMNRETFHLIYVDGDHTYEGARADIEHYAPKIPLGGWLVMDDAAYDQPGTTFWKGYDTVARACLLLAGLGFKNVINIGHNRVFERIR